MGPAPTSSKPLAPTDPSMFNPEGDLKEYRKDVASWVETIQAAAEKGTDRMYKTVYATLARHLYDRGLSRQQKSIVDEAQAKLLIGYKQTDQTEAVKQIGQLIAVVPPIAVVTRLISSFTQLTQCKCRRNEDLNAFVSRFRGLAADHLMHVGLSTSSQVGEVLAITLLNNAMLSEETLTNTKLQLVALAEGRKESESDPELSIRKSFHSSLLEFVDSISELFLDDSLPQSSDNANTCRRKTNDLVEGVQELLQTNSQLFKYFREKSSEELVTRDMFSTGQRCKLNLNDAVTVIRNLTFTPKKPEKSYTKAEIENMVGRRVQQALAAFQKRNDPRKNSSPNSNSNANYRNQSSQASASRGRRSNNRKSTCEVDYCYDCGSKTHVRGSYDCNRPSHEAKRLRALEESAKKAGTDDKDEKGFQQGSNPSQRSHL